MAKDKLPKQTEIARIEGTLHYGLGSFPGLAFILGLPVMGFEFFTEPNPVKLGAFATTWVGWTLFWGLFLLMVKTTNYAVYRTIEPPSDGSEITVDPKPSAFSRWRNKRP